MADPVFGYGVQIKRGNTAVEGETNFTLIPGFFGTINLIGGTADKKEITTHDGATRLKLFAAGLVALKDVGGTIRVDPDNAIHKAVYTDMKLGTFRDYQIVLPSGVVAKQQFRGQVLSFDMMSPMDDYMNAPLTFVVSKILVDIDS